jgi:hypothetical protein
MLYLTKSCEQIQVKSKANNNNNNNIKKNRWYYAERMELSTGMWNIFDSQTSLQLTTDEVDQDWEVNIGYNLFSDDKKLQKNNWQSGRCRCNEKDVLLKRMAEALAEEERDADLKEDYDSFMRQRKGKQTFIDFKLALAAKIEQPSNHIVTGKSLFLSRIMDSLCVSHSLSFAKILWLSHSLSHTHAQCNLDWRSI